MGRDTFHYTRLLKAPSNLTLSTSRERASTSTLGNLFQCLTTLTIKNFFLTSNLNLSSFSLKPLCLVLLIHALVKSPSPAFLQAPFRYWKAALRCPWSLLFYRLNTHNSLSLSSLRRGVPGLWSFSWPSFGPTPTGPCLSCAEEPGAGHRTPSGVSPGRSRGAESSPLTCWPGAPPLPSSPALVFSGLFLILCFPLLLLSNIWYFFSLKYVFTEEPPA